MTEARRNTHRYVIVSPVRNEAAYLDDTIRCVVSQTVRPSEWVIVDDGSSDQTGAIADRAAEQHGWVHVVHRDDRGQRLAARGVMEAVNDGLRAVRTSDWDFLVKLDGDLSFQPDYFERCFAEFHNDPSLGVGGGAIVHNIGGRMVSEPGPLFHVRGATKVYRRDCWEGIAPLISAPGWDTLDEVKANMLGWTTRTFPQIHALHHRPTGAADGAWKNAVKNGRANYISGYDPLFMFAKVARRAFRNPLSLQWVGLLWGFAGGYLQRQPQVADSNLVEYLRSQQRRRILGQTSIWH